MGAFGLLLHGLRLAELDPLALKMDPELDPVETEAGPLMPGRKPKDATTTRLLQNEPM
jgi:hypothetical protein